MSAQPQRTCSISLVGRSKGGRRQLNRQENWKQCHSRSEPWTSAITEQLPARARVSMPSFSAPVRAAGRQMITAGSTWKVRAVSVQLFRRHFSSSRAARASMLRQTENGLPNKARLIRSARPLVSCAKRRNSSFRRAGLSHGWPVSMVPAVPLCCENFSQARPASIQVLTASSTRFIAMISLLPCSCLRIGAWKTAFLLERASVASSTWRTITRSLSANVTNG